MDTTQQFVNEMETWKDECRAAIRQLRLEQDRLMDAIKDRQRAIAEYERLLVLVVEERASIGRRAQRAERAQDALTRAMLLDLAEATHALDMRYQAQLDQEKQAAASLQERLNCVVLDIELRHEDISRADRKISEERDFDARYPVEQ